MLAVWLVGIPTWDPQMAALLVGNPVCVLIPASPCTGPLMQYGMQGGSPWGAGTLAGPAGDRSPSDDELEYAQHQVRGRRA